MLKAFSLARVQLLNQSNNGATTMFSLGSYSSGSGAGKSGSEGGSIRQAGGAFGELEVARENEYFRKMQKLQLTQLKEQVAREVRYHEQQIKHHQESIDRHKKRESELAQEEKSK